MPIDGDVRDVLRQLGHGGDRGGDQAVALLHEAAERHRLPRIVPRPLARRAGADVEQVDPAPRLRSADARRLSRAVSRHLSLQRQRRRVRRGVALVHPRPDPRPPHRARRSLGDRRRADPGRGRLHRPAAGVPAGAARADEAARDHAGARRSAVRHGTHGEDVRGRALRRHGRHRQHREGDRLGPAARHHLRARRGHELAAGRAREHVRRQPRRLRGGARHASSCCASSTSRTPRPSAST